MDQQLLDKTNHDLDLLPQWGPYTKKYSGTSHIADKAHGIRFDLSIFSGIYRRRSELPNVLFETSYYPWQATPDLNFYEFRHMLEWKDQVFCDISYQLKSVDCQLFKARLVNNTDLAQSLCLHLLASIHFPGKREYEPDNTLVQAKALVVGDAKWLNSNQFSKYITTTEFATDNLAPDGKFKCENAIDGFVFGHGIEFGLSPNDKIKYQLNTIPGQDIKVAIRYTSSDDRLFKFFASGVEAGVIELKKSEHPAVTDIIFKAQNSSTEIELYSQDSANGTYLDGFLYGPLADVELSSFVPLELEYTPQVHAFAGGYILKYPSLDYFYAIKFFTDAKCEKREFISDNLDPFFAKNANEHVNLRLVDQNSQRHYTNWFIRPLNLAPNSSEEIYGLVANGSLEQVEKLLNIYEFTEQLVSDFNRLTAESLTKLPIAQSASKYHFGQQIINATTLTNVVFPVYTSGEFIRHSTPGRWWDCLYTWDSGFIGLGLLELDEGRAIENLLVYLTDEKSQNAFIHHGSPVPVQFYLAWEIFNLTQDLDFAAKVYPCLKRYYEFLVGRYGSSDTNRFTSGLLQTWSYFYNSGGWDDYPAQKYCHDSGIVHNVTPVITTAHVMRCGAILANFASLLGYGYAEVSLFAEDRSRLFNALQQYSWDEESGYFSYVIHEAGIAARILKASDGSNFNQGLDGIYPLIANVCDSLQTKRLLRHLKSPQELFSPIGISAVSQSASYYRNDGYWNGTIWFAHQWFFWKFMLDLGETEFADKIAQTALDIWERECRSSYRSLEHFVIESSRGAGWSSFSGLSCPIINWYHAYFKSGRINVGFDCALVSCAILKERLVLRIKTFANKSESILVCLPDTWHKPTAMLNLQPIELIPSLNKSAFYLLINADKNQDLEIVITG